MIKPIYEFILWPNCNNNCSFCWQKSIYRNNMFDHSKKEKAVNECIDEIEKIKEESFHVLLVGGEIFENPKIFKNLYKLFDTIIELQIKGKIELLYINTNLIYRDKTALAYLLDKIRENGLIKRLKFTTSYDTRGRFKTITAEKIFRENIQWLTENYEGINIVINTMLSKQVCRDILDGIVFEWGEEIYINFIPYIVLDESLTPNREELFKALLKIDEKNKGYLNGYIENFDLKQQKNVYEFDGDKFINRTAKYSDCGHSVNFKMYSEKGTCFICDLKELYNVGS